MPSLYLVPQDYATYELPSTTTEAQVIQASAIIDGYLNKPDGLVYLEDPPGNPVAMEATGLPITESRALNAVGKTLLSYKPVVKIISASYNDMPGGYLPRFVNADLSRNSRFLVGGDFWLTDTPYRVDTTVVYIAGWTYANLPSAIKEACAMIINLNNSVAESGAINASGIVTKYRAGDTEVDFAKPFTATALTFNSNLALISMLAPYRRVFA